MEKCAGTWREMEGEWGGGGNGGEIGGEMEKFAHTGG